MFTQYITNLKGQESNQIQLLAVLQANLHRYRENMPKPNHVTSEKAELTIARSNAARTGQYFTNLCRQSTAI